MSYGVMACWSVEKTSSSWAEASPRVVFLKNQDLIIVHPILQYSTTPVLLASLNSLGLMAGKTINLSGCHKKCQGLNPADALERSDIFSPRLFQTPALLAPLKSKVI
jgi:hypothetical protein